jgi:hypothetical protein
MAYDEDLADRVRAVLPTAEAVAERQMFGGLAFMLGGRRAAVSAESASGAAP